MAINNKHKLSYFNIFCIAFGGIIGWGAFVLPGNFFLVEATLFEVAIAFVFSTIAIIFVSASYCLNFKLSSGSGGEISSSYFSFGRRHGFFCGWMVVLVYIAIVALNVSALPTVTRQILPELFVYGYLYSVKGWSVYIADLIICTSAILFFAYTNTRVARRVGRLQNVVTTLLIFVIVVLASSIFFNDSFVVDTLLGNYNNEVSFDGVLTIFAIAPWAYIGFNIIPQVKMDTTISTKKAYMLMVVSVLCGTIVYLLMTVVTVIGASNILVGANQPWLTGWAVEQLLGRVGLFLIFLGIITAVLAGINAFLYGSARLLYVMGDLKLLPAWFTEVRNGVPVNGVLFVTIVTLLAPFFGRTVLNWIVDMSSVGASIGFLYTGLSGLKASIKNSLFYLTVHLMTCFIALIFLFLLLNPYLSSSLSLESYIALFVWLALGVIFYFGRSFNRHSPSELTFT